MKTIVPDPPLHSLHTTAHSGSSLFSINPGVTAQEGLQQISLLLKGAELNADDISSRLSRFEAERLWSVIHNVEWRWRAPWSTRCGQVYSRLSARRCRRTWAFPS